MVDDFCGSTAIAIQRALVLWLRSVVLRCCNDLVFIRAHYLIPARLYGFNPFGFIAQGDTRHLMEVGLFLHATGVVRISLALICRRCISRYGSGSSKVRPLNALLFLSCATLPVRDAAVAQRAYLSDGFQAPWILWRPGSSVFSCLCKCRRVPSVFQPVFMHRSRASSR